MLHLFHPKRLHRFTLVLTGLLAAGLFGVGVSLAQDIEASGESSADTTYSVQTVPDAAPEATVDWFEELAEGGLTMVALAVLSIAMVVFILERLFRLRASTIAPADVSAKVVRLATAKQYDEAASLCKKDPSVFAEVGEYLISHREVDPQLTMAGASDIAARAIDKELERAYPLAVIASLAPLLGLLGTMIGMIEAFKLVEVFGDEGGASLLAGSISKALITTAVGLILAIPALIAYHFFRHRVNLLADRLERETDAVFRACYFKSMAVVANEATANKPDHEGFNNVNGHARTTGEPGTTRHTEPQTDAPEKTPTT